MRTDVFAPRTWLLAAVAGWAVLAWVLALAGMGGRIAATDASADQARPLPQLPQAAPGPLGPLSQYSEIAARPLFSENRQPQPFFIDGGQSGQASNDFDYVLSSVMIVPGLQLAILQPREGGAASVSFKLGEGNPRLPGWSLVELQPRGATFLGPQGPRKLPLRSFDGSGGAGPSATPRTAATPARPPQQGGARPPQPPSPTAMPGNPLTAGVAAKAAAAQGAPPAAAPVPPPSTPTEPAPQTSEERMEAIRKRIQARRQQLQQQQQRDASQNTQ